MRISWLGHACFVVEHNDYRVVIDPFCDVPGYRDVKVEADKVLCSHGHFDHAYTDGVTLREGKERPFTVETVETFHDDREGTLRGMNTVHVLRTDDLTVVHLGDLGHVLAEEQAAKLRGCDVLMIPVGGFYTIDAVKARETAAQLNARIILPMHYKTEYNKDWPISGPEAFLSLYDSGQICRDAEALRVTAADMECQPKIVLFHG